MEKYCVGLDYTLKEIIEKFDVNKDRVAVVTNQNNKVIGVISQGDIIRALCSGISLYTKIECIAKPSFLYLRERNMEEALKMFQKAKITLLPVVDNEYHLTGVITLDDIYDYLVNK